MALRAKFRRSTTTLATLRGALDDLAAIAADIGADKFLRPKECHRACRVPRFLRSQKAYANPTER